MDTAIAVSAVVSAFHGGTYCMTQIRKRTLKNKRATADRILQEKRLLEILDDARRQISDRYAFGLEELGAAFQMGDAMASAAFLPIAIMMQSQLVRCLQIAAEKESIPINLSKLQEDATMYKQTTLNNLDQLRARLLSLPAPRGERSAVVHSASAPLLRPVGSQAARFPSAGAKGCTSILENDSDEEDSTINKILSIPRATRSRQSSRHSESSRFSFRSRFDWLIHTGSKRSSEAAARSQSSLEVFHPRSSPGCGLTRRTSVDFRPPVRPASSNFSNRSGYSSTSSRSGEISHDVNRSSSVRRPKPLDLVPLQQRTLLSPSRSRSMSPAHSVRTSSRSAVTSPLASPASSTTSPSDSPGAMTASLLSAFPTPSLPVPTRRQQSLSPVPTAAPYVYRVKPRASFSFPRPAPLPPVAVTGQSLSPILSAFPLPPTTRPPPPPAPPGKLKPEVPTQSPGLPLSPPPPKPQSLPLLQSREEPHQVRTNLKGSTANHTPAPQTPSPTTKPALPSQSTPFHCSHCTSTAPHLHSTRKPPPHDPQICVAANGRVRFKWLFLTRSQVKASAGVGVSYVCPFCAAEGSSTGNCASVEALAAHLLLGHRGGGGFGVRVEVVNGWRIGYGEFKGREGEGWDVNLR